MGTTTTPLPHLLLLLSLTMFIPTMMGCIPGERESLLGFKAGLHDPSGRLSSWVGHDCCGWTGVSCSNRTGHVVTLALRSPSKIYHTDSMDRRIGGDISPSLLGLQHLRYLDLSLNSFQGIQIPTFFGSLKGLRYLDLSSADFGGLVPHQLGNLSSLRYLDLSMNLMYIESGRWLSNLSSLQNLNLAEVDLSRAPDTLESLNGLQSLSVLDLSFSHLSDLKLVSHVNFTSLRVLHLSAIFTIPPWLFQLTGLQYLDLSFNQLQNKTSLVLASIGNLTSLRVLDLSGNRFIAGIQIPPWLFQLTGLQYLDLSLNQLQNKTSLVLASIGNLTSLRVLDLSDNEFIAGIPASLGNHCELREIDFSRNIFGGNFSALGATVMSGCIKDSLETLSWSDSNLTGQLPDWLGDIKNLKHLDLSSNSFYGQLPASRLSSLQVMRLMSNQLNGTLPENLGQLSELVVLDLSDNNLEGVLSESHFSNLTRLETLDMSSNSLALNVGSDWDPPPRLTDIHFGSCKLGPAFPLWLRKLGNISSVDIPDAGISDALPGWFWSFSSVIVYIDLSNNDIKGVLPSSLRHLNLTWLDVSSNRFEGPVPQFSSALKYLDLSNNDIEGPLPQFSSALFHLDLSNNYINGSIPLSICELNNLMTLDLSDNNLSGGIPTTICSIVVLESLHLNDNGLSGELPLTLINCTLIKVLDLARNKFSGSIPTWIGESYWDLECLRLRSNRFVGNIPPQLGNLQYLQVIDLAHNDLSGTIPHSFGNLSTMKFTYHFNHFYGGVVEVYMKGREERYDRLLPYLSSMDLAGNNLTGEIPEELTTLIGLQNLNLSGNHLTGKIPENISELQWLESLDLSINNLSGAIPTSMIAMHSLDVLNLSFNNFFGKIPYGGQLQALPDPSIYIGNHELCGFPLNTKCQDDGTSQPQQMVKNDESDSEIEGFYLSMGVGFAVGLWTIFGILLINKRWRIAYFQFFDNMYDKIYVALAISMARMNN